MCEIERERDRIEKLLDRTVSPSWFDDPRNGCALVDVACKRLQEDYCDRCSEDCIRARCEAFVARRLAQCAVPAMARPAMTRAADREP